MTSIYDLFATDQEMEREGFWHPVTDKIKFLLARAGGSNTKFTQVLEAKTRPYRRQFDELNKNTDKPINRDILDTANTLMMETFAETVILDWKGVTDAKGKAVKYTSKNALDLLTALPDLFVELREVAATAANFRATEIADDVGN